MLIVHQVQTLPQVQILHQVLIQLVYQDKLLHYNNLIVMVTALIHIPMIQTRVNVYNVRRLQLIHPPILHHQILQIQQKMMVGELKQSQVF